MALDFSQALTDLKAASKVKRAGWVSSPSYIEMFGPLGSTSSAVDTIMAVHTEGTFPWNPQNVDVCADDWEVVAAPTKPKL